MITPTIYKGFPKEGVMFEDIIPCFNDTETRNAIKAWLARNINTTHIIAPEMRGIMLGMLAIKDAHLVPVRKEGKLPYIVGDLITIDITNEYSSYKMEYRLSDLGECKKVIIIDDIIATGGTVIKLMESLKEQGIEVTKVLALKNIFDSVCPGKSLPEELASKIKTYYQ